MRGLRQEGSRATSALPPKARAPPAPQRLLRLLHPGRPGQTVPHFRAQARLPPRHGKSSGPGSTPGSGWIRSRSPSSPPAPAPPVWGGWSAGSASPTWAVQMWTIIVERVKATRTRHRPGRPAGGVGGQASHVTTWRSGRRRSAGTGSPPLAGKLAYSPVRTALTGAPPPRRPHRQKRRRGAPHSHAHIVGRGRTTGAPLPAPFSRPSSRAPDRHGWNGLGRRCCPTPAPRPWPALGSLGGSNPSCVS